ncbi:MAG: sigma-70 family RNA polymerase sigma factor [Elusimicrobia bacterium]|nr:sigma-70 family RNA polymerase sigma factor [Elusimicrobiota bacterium]
MDDNDLVSRAKDADRDAFAELVRRHHAWVMGLCAATLGDRSVADDAAQEVFLKAYKSLPKFQGGSSFSTWLHRIAANLCLDLLRQRARRKTESWDELVDKEGDRIQRLLAEPAAPEHSAEDADLVARVLAQLSPEYRLILTLREVQGLSYEEAAAAMGCSLDSVKARLQRARKDFAERLRHFSDPLSV